MDTPLLPRQKTPHSRRTLEENKPNTSILLSSEDSPLLPHQNRARLLPCCWRTPLWEKETDDRMQGVMRRGERTGRRKINAYDGIQERPRENRNGCCRRSIGPSSPRSTRRRW